MAGQGRTLLILGGVLVAGIAAVIWAVMSTGTDDSPADDVGAPAAPGAPADPGKAAPSAGRSKRQGTAALFGEVRRSAGKAPVAGQEVLLTPERGEPWTVVTDAAGSFRFDKIPHGGAYELSAAAKGCGTIRIPGIALDRNEQRNVGTLYLDPSVKLTVRVRSPADAPVAGAVVEAFPVPQWVDWDWSKALAQIGQAPISVAKATTDSNGEALFPEMAVGDWTITAKKEGYAPSGQRGVDLRSDEEPRPVTIRLATGYPLDGRVIDAEGRPLPGALVLAGTADSAWDVGAAPLRARVTTAEDGRFAFTALPSGDAQLWVGRPGGVPSPAATVRVPLVLHYDIVLKGGGTLTGTVTDVGAGAPVEGATVRATSWESGTAHSAEAVSDAQGKYSIAVAEGAINQLTAEKEGLVQVRDEAPAMGMNRQATLAEGATVVRDLKMRRGARLSGVVKGAGGPLGGARVLVSVGSPNEGYSQRSATTNADGRYEFPALDKGLRLVVAEKEGWFLPGAPDQWWQATDSPEEAKEFKVEIPESGELTRDFELKRGAVVSGLVQGPDGAPLAGARVGAPGADDSAPTGADGAFRIEGVKPGAEVRVWCSKEGFVSASTKPLAVTGEPVEGLVLRMLRRPHVRGTVAAADGAALRDAKVLLAHTDPGDDESPWSERWRWANAIPVPVRPDGAFDAPIPFEATGRLLVRAVSLDQQQADAKPIELVEGQEGYEVRLVLAEGRDLTGRVIAKGGAPVAGADVSLSEHRENNGGDMEWYGGEAQTVWVVSGADGSFAVPHLAPGRYDVRAEARGYVVTKAVADLETGAPVTIELAPEMTIAGTVVLADGRPVEGVEVVANQTGNAVLNFGGFPDGRPPATTDARGSFRVTGLADGRYSLQASAPWGSEINVRTTRLDGVPAGTTGVKVTIQEGGRIGGHLVDSNRRPVTNAWITAQRPQKEGDPAPDGDNDWHGAQARPDGTFAIVGLDLGPYDLDVSANGGSGGFRPAHLTGIAVGTKDLEVVLEAGLSISGVVVGPDDRPVGQIAIQAEPVDGGNGGQSTNAWTDGQGKFTLAGLASGAYRLATAAWGPNQGWVIESKDPVQAGAQNVRIVVTKGVTISGVVVDENGKPLAGVNVMAGDPTKGNSWRNAQSKSDGAFELGGLAEGGSYFVSASAPRRVGFQAQGVQPGAAIRIVLAKGIETTGRVTDASGKAMPNAALLLTHADGKHSQNVQTDTEGRFVADGLTAGDYTAQVFVQEPGGGAWKPCGGVKAGDADVTLRVQQ